MMLSESRDSAVRDDGAVGVVMEGLALGAAVCRRKHEPTRKAGTRLPLVYRYGSAAATRRAAGASAHDRPSLVTALSFKPQTHKSMRNKP